MSIKVGVISDTHGVLHPEVLETIQDCDFILHAGDIDKQPVLEAIQDIAPVYVVRGNNDWGRWAERLPRCLQFTIGGVRFMMTHNRMDLPRDLGDAQVVIFGHSHQYLHEQINGRVWLNPGSCGWPRFGRGLTLALLTIHEKGLDVQQVAFEP